MNFAWFCWGCHFGAPMGCHVGLFAWRIVARCWWLDFLRQGLHLLLVERKRIGFLVLFDSLLILISCLPETRSLSCSWSCSSVKHRWAPCQQVAWSSCAFSVSGCPMPYHWRRGHWSTVFLSFLGPWLGLCLDDFRFHPTAHPLAYQIMLLKCGSTLLPPCWTPSAQIGCPWHHPNRWASSGSSSSSCWRHGSKSTHTVSCIPGARCP